MGFILAVPLLAASLAGADATHFYADKLDLMWCMDSAGTLQHVKTPDDWKRRVGHVKENMQRVMGPLPSRDSLPDLDIRVEEEFALARYTQKKISFVSERGDRVPAYLLVPHNLKGASAAMLCLHQTIPIGKGEVVGLNEHANLQYGKELAERGYVVLAPDYPRFGDYMIDVYGMGYESATAKGIWNHMRAVDVLQSLPEVDPERIGCIGHSLGGHNTLFLGVFDERVKVLVTSCGFCRFGTYYKGDLTGWSHKGYMPRIASEYGKDPARMPFDFTEILAALAPRYVFINAPEHDANFDVTGVRDCVRAAQPVYALYGAEENLVAQHPECEHDFPREVRFAAYDFVDAALRACTERVQ